MRCPYCDYDGSKVLDSRPVNDNKSIRRRRECEHCGRRFTTFETVEEMPLVVIKKDGRREEFKREKIMAGLLRACEKRPISTEQLEVVISDIEKELRGLAITEVPSEQIGELVMQQLYKLDVIAYIRFASVYRQFHDINMFMDEIRALAERNGDMAKPANPRPEPGSQEQ
jgi:transcriptional repressor NrdR